MHWGDRTTELLRRRKAERPDQEQKIDGSRLSLHTRRDRKILSWEGTPWMTAGWCYRKDPAQYPLQPWRGMVETNKGIHFVLLVVLASVCRLHMALGTCHQKGAQRAAAHGNAYCLKERLSNCMESPPRLRDREKASEHGLVYREYGPDRICRQIDLLNARRTPIGH